MNEFNIRINEKVIEVKIVDDLFVEVNNIKYAYSLILLEKEKYLLRICLLYTSDAADERSSVDLGGRRIIKKKTKVEPEWYHMKKKKER